MSDVQPERVRRPRPLAEVRPFAMLYLGECADLAGMLTLQQLRVFLGLTRQMAYNASFRYSNKRLADELDMHPSKVSVAIRGLKDLGVTLWVGPEQTRIYLNPRYVWHGDRRGRALATTELVARYPAASFIPEITDDDLAAIEQHPDLPDIEPVPEEDR